MTTGLLENIPTILSADKNIIKPDKIIKINPYLTAVKYDSCTLKKFLAPNFVQ